MPCGSKVTGWQYQVRRRIFTLAFFCALCLAGINYVWAEDATVNLKAPALVQHLQEELPSIREIIGDMDAAPVSAFFTRDKQSYEAELNDYLDDALSLLLPEMYGDIRRELQEMDIQLERLKEKKSATDAERAFRDIGAEGTSGVESAVRSVLGDNVGKFLFGDSLEIEIGEAENRRDQLIGRFRDQMRAQFGLPLTTQECESLLYQVNGGDLIEAIAVADVLTDVEAHIRDIITTQSEDFSKQVRRQYYGLALVVRLIIERLTERHLDNYDEKYLPALAELRQENERIRDDTESILDEVTGHDTNHETVVQQNIRSLDMARRAIDYYRQMLTERREKVSRMLAEAKKEALVARSTLMTLEHVMNVGHVASKAFEEFTSLSQLTAPDLLALDDQQLYEEFLDISRSLSVRITG